MVVLLEAWFAGARPCRVRPELRVLGCGADIVGVPNVVGRASTKTVEVEPYDADAAVL
jgi:hypothetical protein